MVLKTQTLQPQTVVVEGTDEEYMVLADASTHGARFHITGRGTACDIKMFKVLALRKCRI